jgi:hypothetical protein
MDSLSDRVETIWDIVDERDGRLVLRPTHEKNQKRITIILLGLAAAGGLILFSRLGGGIAAAILAAVAGAGSLFLIATFFHRLELTRVPGTSGGRVVVRGGRPLWWRIPRELPVGEGAGVVRPIADRYRGQVVGWSWQYTLSADPRFAVSIGYSTREEDVSRVPFDVRDVAGRLSKLFGVPWGMNPR